MFCMFLLYFCYGLLLQSLSLGFAGGGGQRDRETHRETIIVSAFGEAILGTQRYMAKSQNSQNHTKISKTNET